MIRRSGGGRNPGGGFPWIPAYAGMTTDRINCRIRRSGGGRNPGGGFPWVPACAGMTGIGLITRSVIPAEAGIQVVGFPGSLHAQG